MAIENGKTPTRFFRVFTYGGLIESNLRKKKLINLSLGFESRFDTRIKNLIQKSMVQFIKQNVSFL